MIDGMTKETQGGLVFYRWNALKPWNSFIEAGLSTRGGGLGSGPWESLNLAYAVGEDSETVQENRRYFLSALGYDLSSWTSGEQVHGKEIALVDAKACGSGRDSEHPSISRTDALLVTQTGALLVVFLADCLPVILYDPEQQSGALCHAGWRGTAQGITAAAVSQLVACRGSRPADLVAVIGPGISSCCYFVGREVFEEMSANFSYPPGVFTPQNSGAYSLDLEAANLAWLLEAGLKKEHIGRAGFCTACREREFFSYRKSGGKTGRQVAFFSLKKVR